MNFVCANLSEARSLVLSENFTLPVPASALIRLVYDAAAQVPWLPAPRFIKGDTTPDPVLRSLVTFSYGTGIYSSQEIEAAAVHDPAVRYIAANHQPCWETIRDFRRRNSPALKLAIAGLFASALGISPVELHGEKWHLHAAEQRLARAIQADSYALDV